MTNYKVLKKTNILKVLEEERGQNFNITLQRLLKELDVKKKNSFIIDLLDKNRIYHINQIKVVCINYRLRFLDIKYFKNKIPVEALNQIELLEKEHNNSISDFKIMAPSKWIKMMSKEIEALKRLMAGFNPFSNLSLQVLAKFKFTNHPLIKQFVQNLSGESY